MDMTRSPFEMVCSALVRHDGKNYNSTKAMATGKNSQSGGNWENDGEG
jgi:hypothetical protein